MLQSKLNPSGQFVIGFSSPFRVDRNSSGGGIMIFVWEEIPYKFLKSTNQTAQLKFYLLK